MDNPKGWRFTDSIFPKVLFRPTSFYLAEKKSKKKTSMKELNFVYIQPLISFPEMRTFCQMALSFGDFSKLNRN